MSMDQSYVLGIDVGSSALKAALFDLRGNVSATAAQSYPTNEPQPDWREQHPAAWWDAAKGAIREIIRGVERHRILAVGAAGYISSLTFLDRAGRPLRPAIGFQDRRARGEVDELQRLFNREELAGHLGADLPPAATWPLPRLLWLKSHEPETMVRAYRLLQAKDYLNLRLTGEFASDVSSNRGIVDFATGKPATKLLEALGLRSQVLPQILAPHEIIGTVSRDAADETGLPTGVPVVAGWNDLNAAVLGSGAVHAGDAFNCSGTSEHIGVVASETCRLPELVCSPFLPGRKLFYGVTSSGGGSLDWYQRISSRTTEEALRIAETVPPGAESLLFLPYLEGERCPVWDAEASGAFLGIRTHHAHGHFVRAILEGVAFGLRQIWELVETRSPINGNPITVSGGAARAALWSQIKADILDHPIQVPENAQAGAAGAAMLAAVGAGCYRDGDEAARAMARISVRFEPHVERSDAYQGLYRLYCELYPRLRTLFPQLHSQYLRSRRHDDE